MFKLFRFLKQYTVQIIAIVILIFIQVLANLYLPTLMADIIDKGIVQNGTLQTISFLGFSGSYKGIDYIIRTGGIMLLISAGGVLCSIIATFLSSRTAVGFGKIIRSKLFAKVESFSLHEVDKIGTATLITRTTNDVTQIQAVTIMIFFSPFDCIRWCYYGFKRRWTFNLDFCSCSSFTYNYYFRDS